MKGCEKLNSYLDQRKIKACMLVVEAMVRADRAESS